MIFRNAHKILPNRPDLILDGHIIPDSNCVSFLGIKLDCNLKFSDHIAFIKHKCTFGIRALIRSKPYFSKGALLSLYFAFIHSHITYGIVSWGNTYHCHLSSIQHLQNQAIRIITNSNFFTNASPLLRDHNILHITGLFRYHLTIMFHKLLNKQLSYDFIDSRHLTNTNITRFAHSSNFLLPIVHTNYGKMTSTFTAIKLWNDLPLTVKTSSVHEFKYAIKLFYLQM